MIKKSMRSMLALIILAFLFVACAESPAPTPTASLSLDKTSIPLPGEQLTVSGTGFTPNKLVGIELVGTWESKRYGKAHTNPAVWSGEADSSGAIKITIPVARVKGAISTYDLKEGDYKFAAVQEGREMATVAFKLVAKP